MMKSKQQWAEHWAAKGFFVFPCFPNTKIPALKEDWPSLATRDPAVIARWWGQWPDANIGAHPGASGHVVIDVDNKKGKSGDDSLALLQLDLGDLPETLTCRTPSGGLHLWLKLEGSCGNSANSLAPSIDTRGRRGFVVMPGSYVIDEKGGYEGPYEVTADAEPAEAPDGWAAALRALGNREERRKAHDVRLDAPELLSKARRYLESLVKHDDVAVEGQGGNDRTYRLAAALADMGLSEGSALALADELWNAHCVPPWDYDELERIFQNAYTYAQNEHGAKASGDPSGAGFAGIKALEKTVHTEQKRSRFAPLSLTEAQELPEPAWLVPGWVPLYATTVIYGRPGSMKSFAALDAALSVAAGREAWGLDYQPTPRPVVYVAGEGQIGVAKLRAPAWMQHHGEKDAPFFLITATPRAGDLQRDLEEMFAEIERRCAGALPRLVVYDTHARVMAGLDENSAQDTSKALELYDATARRYSCAVIAIHHSGKDGASERGSTALSAGVDVVLRMEYDKDARRAILSCDKMKDAEQGKPLSFAPVKAGGSIVLERREATPIAKERAPSQLYADIVQILKRHEAHNIAKALSIKSVCAELPDVECIEDEEAKEKARQRMEASLRRALKRELKPLAAPAEGFLMLPPPA